MSHSSHKITELAELRSQLEKINAELFSAIAERRKTVSSIQAAKTPGVDGWTSFDPVREKTLFLSLAPQLKALSLKECLAFSLLMEAHAGSPQTYPEWSMGIHLDEALLREEHRLNPILLKILNPEFFESLKLRPSFRFLASI